MTKPDYAVITDAVLPQVMNTDDPEAVDIDILDIGSGAGYGVVHYVKRFPKARVLGIEYDAPSAALAVKTLTDSNSGGNAPSNSGRRQRHGLRFRFRRGHHGTSLSTRSVAPTLTVTSSPRAHRALRPRGRLRRI